MNKYHPRPSMRGRRRYDWWRAYHGLPQHAKWRSVALTANVPVSVVFHIVVCLLDHASRAQPRGSIASFRAFDCAGVVNVPKEDIVRVLEVLKAVHWIKDDMLAEWDDRQPQREDDYAAARKAEQRSRNVTHPMRDTGGTQRDETVRDSGAAQRDIPQSHATIAGQGPPSRDVPQRPAVSSTVTKLTPPDKDKDTSLTSSVLGAARERVPTNSPARSLATASEPQSGIAAKRPSDVTRRELDEQIERRRAEQPNAVKP